MQDGWIGLAWLAVPWYPVAVHHAGSVDWAGLVSSALVSSGSPPCGMPWVDWAGLVSSALVSSGSPPCRIGWPGKVMVGLDMYGGV